MNVFLDNSWHDNYLDEALRSGHVRIKVQQWSRHQTLDNVYVVRKAGIHSLLGYVAKVGLVEVMRKIRSRYAERTRNVRWFCSGEGEILEVGAGSSWQVGDRVVFLAPSHTGGMERVVLAEGLIRSAEKVQSHGKHGVLDAQPLPDIERVAGWTYDSGRVLELAQVERLLGEAAQSWQNATEIHPMNAEASPVLERRKRLVKPEDATDKRPTAMIVGLGNYAKTIILPSVQSQLRVETIFELDPLQMGASPPDAMTWDTSPVLREGDKADVVFIAGYHHTHTPLALEAIRRGAAVLIEKPAATTMEQVVALRKAMEESKRPVNIGFHRRFLPFNDYLKTDLAVSAGQPIDYACIVFEEPLPELHWYGWPNSKTRLTSNGCHWIDHFLFINGFPKITSQSVKAAKQGTLVVMLEAENGAFFSMTLLDVGSARLGVQDHVECRTKGRTVTITNALSYIAEDNQKIIRKARIPGLLAHRRMYSALVKNMLVNQFDDNSHSALQAAEICLQLEATL
jgi:predicted dehydrogenase